VISGEVLEGKGEDPVEVLVHPFGASGERRSHERKGEGKNRSMSSHVRAPSVAQP